jgi:hypothetical protein
MDDIETPKRPANVEQSRRANAVYALFIFLNLLERNAQLIAKVSLAQVGCVPD